MTHIETNMENIMNNVLLYIEHSYNKTYNCYKSIVETILNLLFGTPYSIEMVDWGKHSSSTHGNLQETLYWNHHLVPIEDFFIGDNNKR
jgi:hypothetical protein